MAGCFAWLKAPKPCQYVDEDAGKYYYHVLGSKVVTTTDGTQVIDDVREEEAAATLRWNAKLEGFEDDKLCRVRREDEDLGCCRCSFLLSKKATQQSWFEIAYRCGKQLPMKDWPAARDALQKKGKRFMKIVGFDGGRELASVPWEAVAKELNNKADILIWDGDWYSDKGWTKLIPEFLRGGSGRMAVAFQKQAEVPGFHRQYWHVYKEFPGRVWMVVLPDDLGSLPPEVSAQVAWLEEQAGMGNLKKCWVEKYVGVAMRGRAIQGPVPVLAINGGGVAMAQAAIELMKGDLNIPWTVFPGDRVGGKPVNTDETVIGFVQACKQRSIELPNLTSNL